MRSAMVLAVLVAFLPVDGRAQGRGVEFGAGVTGLGLTFSNDGNTFTAGVTSAAFSAAFFTSDRFAFEPMLGGSVSWTEGATTAEFLLDLGLPIYFRPTRGQSGVYVRPVLGAHILTHSRLDWPVALFAPGIGFGTKVSVQERLSLRFEAVGRHYPDHGLTRVIGLVGVSLFAR
jgi:hypothetical protein